ncbi:hypothetical protein ACX0HA_05780 [Flavobacterium hauense]
MAFRSLLMLLCALFFTIVMGYLIDDLFNKQWYGYIFLGMTLSFVIYTFRVQKKLEVFPEMPLYFKFALVFLFTLLTCLSMGFIADRFLDMNLYKECLMAAVFSTLMGYNAYRAKIKKQ